MGLGGQASVTSGQTPVVFETIDESSQRQLDRKPCVDGVAMPGANRALPGLAVAQVYMISLLRHPEEARLEVQRSGCPRERTDRWSRVSCGDPPKAEQDEPPAALNARNFDLRVGRMGRSNGAYRCAYSMSGLAVVIAGDRADCVGTAGLGGSPDGWQPQPRHGAETRRWRPNTIGHFSDVRRMPTGRGEG